jgi:hypothetical protein
MTFSEQRSTIMRVHRSNIAGDALFCSPKNAAAARNLAGPVAAQRRASHLQRAPLDALRVVRCLRRERRDRRDQDDAREAGGPMPRDIADDFASAEGVANECDVAQIDFGLRQCRHA